MSLPDGTISTEIGSELSNSEVSLRRFSFFLLFKSFCKHYGLSRSSVHEWFRAEELSDPSDFKSNACTIYDVHNIGKGNGCAKLFYLWARLTLLSST